MSEGRREGMIWLKGVPPLE
jgi:hypothetical protein